MGNPDWNRWVLGNNVGVLYSVDFPGKQMDDTHPSQGRWVAPGWATFMGVGGGKDGKPGESPPPTVAEGGEEEVAE